MKVIKQHSHKHGFELITEHHSELFDEIGQAVSDLKAISCLTKISQEESRVKKWGGLIFSPPTINQYFRQTLYPLGWAIWDEKEQNYKKPRLNFADGTTRSRADRFRELDGLKERIGLEVQLGKYAFMGYDIFSKMIIFHNNGLIDYGIEIVLVQDMVDCMSTGVSAFEHIMIDFEHRGEADIDIPVLVLGIGPTTDEWQEVFQLQEMYRTDPKATRRLYPAIGSKDLKGTIPGPK